MGVIRALLPREQRALTATEAVRRMIQSTITRSGVAVNEPSAIQLVSIFTAGLGLLEGVLVYAGAGALIWFLARKTFSSSPQRLPGDDPSQRRSSYFMNDAG